MSKIKRKLKCIKLVRPDARQHFTVGNIYNCVVTDGKVTEVGPSDYDYIYDKKNYNGDIKKYLSSWYLFEFIDFNSLK